MQSDATPPNGTDLDAPPVSGEARIDSVGSLADEVRAMAPDGSIETDMAIARRIVEALFGGNPRAWRHTPRFKQLVQALRGSISARRLQKMLDAFLVWSATPELSSRDVSNLSLEHLHALKFVAPPARLALVERAATEGWTLAQLKARVDRARSAPKRGGRPRTPADLKWLGTLPDEPVDRAVLERLSAEAANRHLIAAERAQRRVREISEVLCARLLTATGSVPRVLVVDDEESARKTLKRTLERVGVEVTACATGAEALTLSADLFDAAVVDIRLKEEPEPDGIELARKLLARKIARHVVFVTGFAEEIEMGLAAGIGPVIERCDVRDDLVFALHLAFADDQSL